MEDLTKNKIFKFISEHFALVLFIPLLVGGITQVANLYYLSPVYVRFFSPTQAVADGILIFAYLLLSFVSVIIISSLPIMNRYVDIMPEIHEDGLVKSQSKIFYFIISVILGIILVALFIMLFRLNNSSQMLGLYIILIGIISFVFSMFIGAFAFSSRYKGYHVDPEKNEGDEYFLIPYIGFPVLVSMVLLSFLSYNSCQNSNFKSLKDRFSTPLNESKILYYNDKYIFLERIQRHTQQHDILILKFENLLESEVTDENIENH